MRPRRVLAYARVSSEEQARGTSLRDQQAAIEAWAKARSLTVTRFFVEAESAVREKLELRVQMRALLDSVREGDLVLCDKVDRWSRDPEFTYRSVREILQARASFYAVGDACDPSTPEGDTMLSFRVLFAREEHKRIRQRMLGTRETLRDQGYYVEGEVPFGYRRPDTKDRALRNVLEVVEREAVVVREVFRLYLGGLSMGRVGEELGLRVDRVKRLLDNRHYTGQVRSRPSGAGRKDGEWIAGRHPALVTLDTFLRARARADERRHGGPRVRGGETRTSGWILRDVAICGRCGARMSSAWSGAREYYRCSRSCTARGPQANSGSYLRVDEVEAIGAELVRERLVELRAELGKPAASDGRAKKLVVTAADKRVRLTARRARLAEAYADGAMTREQLRERLAKVDGELAALDADEEPRPSDRPSWRREALREVAAIEHTWQVADGPERRQIVNHLASAMALYPGPSVTPRWRPLEELIA